MMSNAQLGIHLGVLVTALLCTGIAQLLSVRLSGGRVGVVASLFLGFMVGVAILGLGEGFAVFRAGGALADNLALGLANFVLFVCLWYFYFHFINIGEASLRIRVLREAARFSGRPLADLLAVYNVRTVVGTRMERLVQDGQLVIVGEDRFAAGKPRMVLVAKAFSFLRWLLLGQTATSDPKS